jgi:hypothetical protein
MIDKRTVVVVLFEMSVASHLNAPTTARLVDDRNKQGLLEMEID